jgi:hypothetical protein
MRPKQRADDGRSGHSILGQITRDYLLIFFHCLFKVALLGVWGIYPRASLVGTGMGVEGVIAGVLLTLCLIWLGRRASFSAFVDVLLWGITIHHHKAVMMMSNGHPLRG